MKGIINIAFFELLINPVFFLFLFNAVVLSCIRLRFGANNIHMSAISFHEKSLFEKKVSRLLLENVKRLVMSHSNIWALPQNLHTLAGD